MSSRYTKSLFKCACAAVMVNLGPVLVFCIALGDSFINEYLAVDSYGFFC